MKTTKRHILTRVFLFAFVTFGLSLGLLACSGVLAEKPGPSAESHSVSVELAGLDLVSVNTGISSRGIGVLPEGATVMVSAYGPSTIDANLNNIYPTVPVGSSGPMVLVGSIWKGNISFGMSGWVLFRAYVKDSLGNFLYFGEIRVNITGDTSVSIPVSVWTKNTPVNLNTAGDFVILSKAGISNANVPTSAITGDIGVSPIGFTAITDFPLSLDLSGDFSTTPKVSGRVYASDYAHLTPAKMSTAVSNMESAYTTAAGLSIPDYTELGGGQIGGLILVPGLYKWGTDVLVSLTSGDVTLDGGPSDVWIFQISGKLTMESAMSVLLTGGAKAKNIFWQVAQTVTLGTTSHLEGVVLSSATAGYPIILETGASVSGRLLSQAAVTLDGNTVTQPAP